MRAATGRKKIAIFNGCYHGTVDDVFVDLVDGQPHQRDSLLGQVHDLTQHTVVVEFNDLPALEKALSAGDVACLLAEPVMTNIGMVLSAAGVLGGRPGADADAMAPRSSWTRPTPSAPGPVGTPRPTAWHPDAMVVGKPIGGGVPCAVYGFSAALARASRSRQARSACGAFGYRHHLDRQPLALAAMRATLTDVATPAAYSHMLGLAERLADGLAERIARHRLPWCVTQVGARSEFQFSPTPPRNGSEAGAMFDAELEHALHLYLFNRGVLITPFHNMMLVCPQTTMADVDRLLEVFEQALVELAPPVA